MATEAKNGVAGAQAVFAGLQAKTVNYYDQLDSWNAATKNQITPQSSVGGWTSGTNIWIDPNGGPNGNAGPSYVFPALAGNVIHETMHAAGYTHGVDATPFLQSDGTYSYDPTSQDNANWVSVINGIKANFPSQLYDPGQGSIISIGSTPWAYNDNIFYTANGSEIDQSTASSSGLEAGEFLVSKFISDNGQTKLVSTGELIVASSGQIVDDAAGYSLTTGGKVAETIQTDSTAGAIQATAQVNFGSSSTTVTISADGATASYTETGAPTVQLGVNSAVTGTDGAILVGSDNATLTGGSGSNLLIALGANDTLNSGSGSNQVLLAGVGDTVGCYVGFSTVSISGTGDLAYIAGGNVSFLGSASSGTIVGNNNAATGLAGDTIGFSGTGETATLTGGTVNLAGGSSATLKGSANTIYVNGSGDGISASSDVLAVAGSETATLNGSGDTIGLSGGDTLWVTGSGDRVNGMSGDSVNLGASTGVTDTGNGQTINLDGASDSLTATGTGDTIGIYGSGDGISASSDVLAVAGSETATLNGSGDTIGLSGGDTLWVTGSGETVNGVSGDSVNLGASTGVTDTGNGQTINLDGASDSLTATGTGDAIGIYGGGAGVSASSDAIAVAGSETATLNGGGDTIGLNGGDTLWVTGSGETVNGVSGDSVNLGASTGVTDTGNGQTINLDGASDSLTATGTGDTIGIYGSGDGVSASSDVIAVAGSETATLNGSGDTIGLNGGDTLWVTGSGDTVNGVSGDSVNLGASTGVTDTGNGQTINLDGASDSLTATGTGDTIGIYGSGDGVSASSDVVAVAGSEAVTVNGNGDTIGLNGGDTLWVTGSGDGVSAAGDTVSVGANSQVSLAGNNDTIGLGGADTLQLAGTGNTVLADNHSSVRLTGGNNTVDYFDTDNSQPWSKMVELINSSGQTTEETTYWDQGQSDESSVWIFDTTNDKLAAIYDYHRDGGYTYTEFNTSHIGQPWSQFQVSVDSQGRTEGTWEDDAFGNPYASYFSPLIHYSGAQVIAEDTELNTPATYYSAIGHGGGETGQTWLDSHVPLNVLEAGWSAQNASIAAGQIAAPVQAIPDLSVINVTVTGFGY